ncbi:MULTISPECIES: metallophosphoesterase [Arthrobacter]|uniref:Metallophosphoesterase n=2 Tax=Arthrobacter TaxID=1663 RepID=A0ABU9KMP1_9MICC|nr:metallophosphoesterase [Arthrobacter sp. YJM1]MDP5226964.1 metallophosphoesterase [Arthrobacter sp. YJM1]
MPDAEAPARSAVVGDVHGALHPLMAALRHAGLLDVHGHWAGGTRTLWFLGDYLDRGPDGAGVVHLVRHLQSEAADDGGAVHALLGNHEVLALGRHRFGTRRLETAAGPRSFEDSWRRNGGRDGDHRELDEDDFAWLARLPGMALAPSTAGPQLLLHADTTEYRAFGSTVEEVNAGLAERLSSDDPLRHWDVWARLTTRHAFRGRSSVAAGFLREFGGVRMIHGHSIIGDALGHPAPLTDGPDVYAEGLVVDIDGGLYDGGPCLVLPLP